MKQVITTFILITICLSMGFSQNHSLDFDGTDDFITINNDAEFQLTTGTIEAWVKTTTPGASYRAIVVKSEAYGLFLVDGKLATYDWAFGQPRVSAVSVDDGNWHHIAMTFQSGVTNGSQFYLDGTLLFSTIITIKNQNSAVTIGENASIQQINAKIDDVRIWNVVRTQTEIQNNKDTELTGTETGLVSYFKMDDNSATCDIKDCTVNENHGTRNGAGGSNNLPQFSTDVPSLTDVACGGGATCTFLPVEFIHFEGKLLNQQVELNWSTASEENNKGFEIQHSQDGAPDNYQNWETLDFVQGNGTTLEAQEYIFTDEMPLANTNYYRLKQVDFDGQFKYSKIVIVEIVTDEKSLSIYPSPVQNELNIVNGEGQATIYNTLGQPVKQLIIENKQLTMNVSDLLKGQYILHIAKQNGNVITKRFVK